MCSVFQMKFHGRSKQEGLKPAASSFLVSVWLSLPPGPPTSFFLTLRPHPVISSLKSWRVQLILQGRSENESWNNSVLRARGRALSPPILVASYSLWCVHWVLDLALDRPSSGWVSPTTSLKTPAGVPHPALAKRDNAPERHGRGWLVPDLPHQAQLPGISTGQHLCPTSMDSPAHFPTPLNYTSLSVPQDSLDWLLLTRVGQDPFFPS